MKKSLTFRMLTLLLVITFVFLSFGCANENGNGDGTDNGDGTEDVVEIDENLKYYDEYVELSKLQGQEALDYFESLGDKGMSDNEILEFFIDLPLSNANKQIYDLYNKEGFAMYAESYPKGETYDNFVWEKGSGTQIEGPYSENNLKLPFTDYVPLEEGTIGDADKEYKIGVVFHGFNHPWLVNWADAAKWEADRHSNVSVIVQDGEFDNNKWASIVDTFVTQGVDGIVVWPAVEAPTGPPVERAIAAGIPVVSVDRTTGAKNITARVTGNFPANGAQSGMYAVWKLGQEGSLSAKVVLLRKPLGSTADAIRTGHFLKVLSYFPEIEILNSYHDNDNREEAFTNAQTALQAYPEIDIIFGTGDHETLAALEAVRLANRLESRADGKKIIFLSIDDSKEAITQVSEGNFDVNTPYTPLISDIGMRAILKIVAGEEMPTDIITPNIPMVTANGETIFGMDTQTPDQWYEYTFGPEIN